MNLSIRVKKFAENVSNTQCTNLSNKIIDLELALSFVMDSLEKVKHCKKSLYIVGNGGSAAVASHALVDFVNVAKIHTQVLHECSLITCMANDYGYENAFSNVLSTYLSPDDALIAISSSGKSRNICNAVSVAKKMGVSVFTLTGFDKDNPLRQQGDINFWLDSKDYGYVEVGHQFILHNLSDRFGVENSRMNSDIEKEVLA